ncbi:MAG: GlsB/YeaQ/YmgE family stress response membrane protein [Erythrobacter sp.]
MLGFIWFIIMGGLIGWVASMVMNRDAQMGKFWNVVVGIVGSFIGNAVFSFIPGLGGGDLGAWPPTIMGVVSALVGAVVLLGIVNLIKRGSVR